MLQIVRRKIFDGFGNKYNNGNDKFKKSSDENASISKSSLLLADDERRILLLLSNLKSRALSRSVIKITKYSFFLHFLSLISSIKKLLLIQWGVFTSGKDPRREIRVT